MPASCARLAGRGRGWAPHTLREGCLTTSGEVGKHPGQGGLLEGERALAGVGVREAVACELRPGLWREACPGRCWGQNPSREGGALSRQLQEQSGAVLSRTLVGRGSHAVGGVG